MKDILLLSQMRIIIDHILFSAGLKNSILEFDLSPDSICIKNSNSNDRVYTDFMR